MGFKIKKLSPSKFQYKNTGLLLYQNLWHLSKLTKKVEKWRKFKGKIYSNELGRPVRKYTLNKMVALSFGDPVNRTHLNKQSSKKINGSSNQIVTAQHFARGVHHKKAFSLIVQPFWFSNKAAPIPGVASLKKAKVLFTAKLRAYKIIQNWLGIITKKQRIVFFNVKKIQNLSNNWNIIVLIESLYQSVVRKISFSLNAYDSNAILKSKFTKVIINGNNINKALYVNKPADLFIYVPSVLPVRLLKNNNNNFLCKSRALQALNHFFSGAVAPGLQ